MTIAGPNAAAIVDAVRPTDADRLPMLQGTSLHHAEQPFELHHEQAARGLDYRLR